MKNGFRETRKRSLLFRSFSHTFDSFNQTDNMVSAFERFEKFDLAKILLILEFAT